ncbi:MAG: IS200/IS605 family transposase [Chroococcidiopsis sp.]
MEAKYQTSYRSVFNLTAHFVFVTKYRKKILTSVLLQELEKSFTSILETRNCKLLEFNGEADHVHLLISYRPEIPVSNLVANLKATSSKNLWQKYPSELEKTYWGKRVLWTGAYFVASCGGVTIDILKQYIENQTSPS